MGLIVFKWVMQSLCGSTRRPGRGKKPNYGSSPRRTASSIPKSLTMRAKIGTSSFQMIWLLPRRYSVANIVETSGSSPSSKSSVWISNMVEAARNVRSVWPQLSASFSGTSIVESFLFGSWLEFLCASPCHFLVRGVTVFFLPWRGGTWRLSQGHFVRWRHIQGVEHRTYRTNDLSDKAI